MGANGRLSLLQRSTSMGVGFLSSRTQRTTGVAGAADLTVGRWRGRTPSRVEDSQLWSDGTIPYFNSRRPGQQPCPGSIQSIPSRPAGNRTRATPRMAVMNGSRPRRVGTRIRRDDNPFAGPLLQRHLAILILGSHHRRIKINRVCTRIDDYGKPWPVKRAGQATIRNMRLVQPLMP